MENIIAGGDPTFASLSSSPPPTRQNDIYRVPCSGLWPWKPSLLLNAHLTLPAARQVCQIAENAGMESLQGQNGWLTCVRGLKIWKSAASWCYTNDLRKRIWTFFCCDCSFLSSGLVFFLFIFLKCINFKDKLCYHHYLVNPPSSIHPHLFFIVKTAADWTLKSFL